ncbi:DUF1778 domain-containing protein [Planctomicrobium sp. SH668]|uniref:type II toxin -antitoxin system TacA 1-like antitoxin n=1 Tax=Planctomicrobium sp. SH668 TaxID=3448126 RepID=UPI003F5C3F36
MAKKKSSTPLPEKAGITLKMSSDEREYLKKAAKASGFTTTASWIMVTLRNQAKDILGTPSPALSESQDGD